MLIRCNRDIRSVNYFVDTNFVFYFSLRYMTLYSFLTEKVIKSIIPIRAEILKHRTKFCPKQCNFCPKVFLPKFFVRYF